MNGRGVLVTGASRGIGRAITQVFAAQGDRVAVHHRDSAEAASETLAALDGSGHVVVQGDVADAASVERFVATAAEALDGIDVLVNNAGVYRLHDPLTSTYAEWQQAWLATLDIDLIGPANVSWCVARQMIERGRGGRIVNVASRGAYRGEPTAPAYAAAKAGMIALGQSLALALGRHGISVTAVAPCFVDTEMAAARIAGPGRAEVSAQSPFNRIAMPEDVAAAVRYLASPEAEFASGTVVDVNGASYLR